MAVIKTLNDIINMDDRYDVNKITFFRATDDGSLIVPDKNLFEIYRVFASPYILTYNVSKAERQYYRFKPYLLSQDVYGTPHLGWMIMMLNDRECASKFYLKKTVRLIPKAAIGEIYGQIATRSADRLSANWNKYLTMVGDEIKA